MCRWQVEDGDVEVVHEVPGRHHLFFVVRCILFIIASCVIGLDLEVEASGKAIVWENSLIGSRVRVGQICKDCE